MVGAGQGSEFQRGMQVGDGRGLSPEGGSGFRRLSETHTLR